MTSVNHPLVLVHFPVAKNPDKSILKEKELISVHSSRVQEATVGKSWRQEPEAAGPILFAVRKQRTTIFLSSGSPSYQVNSPNQRVWSSTFSVGFPTSINLI